MRIMYIIDSMKFGGAEMLLLAMVRRYAAEHQITVVYFTHGPLYEDFVKEGVNVVRISEKGFKDPRVLPRLFRLMRTEKPDVVHTHLSKSDFAGLMIAWLAGVPVRISSIHNVDPWRKNPLFSAFMRLWTLTCQHHIAVSQTVRDYTLQYSHYPADRVSAIDNGVDLDKFNPATVTPADKTQWNANGRTIGMIARLEESKAHHVLLDAAAIITKQFPDVYFVVIGDGPLRPDLEAQRAKLGLVDKVIFTGIQRDIPGILAMLDIQTFSSAWEGLPVALLEGMAMAKAVVSTSVGGIPNVITSGENGILVELGNPQALADGLAQVLSDSTLAAKLSANARKTIEQRFSAAAMHQKILDLYTRFLKK